MNFLKYLFISARPIFIFIATLSYALGIGIAKYLGTSLDWNLVWLGCLFVLLIQLFSHYLYEYFKILKNGLDTIQFPFLDKNQDKNNQLTRLKHTVFIVMIGCLSCAASISILIYQTHRASSSVLLIMAIGVLAPIIYAIPPFQLAYTGYGELLSSLMMTIFTTAFAFLLQRSEVHRLLAMTTFPLFALDLSLMISRDLSKYSRNLKYAQNNILNRLGWQKAMILHNILILGAFLLIAIALVYGLPIKIGLPGFLVLPIGILQIWQMKRIADGYKPNWNNLILTSYIVVIFTTYLLTYSFWIH